MRVGVYAGSFLPFHLGHYDIYNQAKKMFDYVILAIGYNPQKNNYSATQHEIPQGAGIQSVAFYKGFLSDFLKDNSKSSDITLVRGLRNIHDLNAEQNMLAFVRSMYPELKVVYFLSDPKYQHISSSALRDIRKFSEEEYKKYLVPDKEEKWFAPAGVERGWL